MVTMDYLLVFVFMYYYIHQDINLEFSVCDSIM